MPTKSLYISKAAYWAPGLENHTDWKQWAEGNKEIEQTNAVPPLSFTTPLFRRRLSQVSKMTIQVVHDQVELSNSQDVKQVFISFNGEINRTISINEQIIEDGIILPASFSMSVYNTPIALATLASNLKAGYSVIYPSQHNFKSAVLSAAAPVITGETDRIMLIYADEKLPEEYEFADPNFKPFAFAALISSTPFENTVPFSLDEEYTTAPEKLLKYLVKAF